MDERTVEIETADGRMPVFVAHPEEGGPFPPVVVFMDVWGFREQLCDIARRIGTVGYAALVPNLYYRKGGVTFDYRHPDGTTISLKDLPKAEQDRIYAVHGHLTDDMVIADCAALLDFFDGEAAIAGGPVGSVGYCMGGRHVIRAGAGHPGRFRAGASLHPTRMVGDDGPAAPYRDAPKLEGELYIGFGELDHYTPPEVIARVREAFTGAAVTYRDTVHAGAHHGYAIPDRDVYDKAAAARDWERIFAMYDRVLRGR